MADPARLAAYDVLKAVRVDDAYANLVLPRILARHRLAGRDAAFATELAAGALRRRGTWDPVIDACLDRPRLEAKVRDALQLGVHQLLAMRVPAHAAIDTTVELVRSRVGRGPVGLANAVLRRVAADDLATWIERVAPERGADPIGWAAVAHSHPRWIVEALADALGDPDLATGELSALLGADNEPPAVTLVARPGLVERVELPGRPTAWSPHGVVLDGGDPGAIEAVAAGRAGVQDEGSQLVALALAGAPLGGRDERWLDLCAGPGGKAALLAALAAPSGARLVAVERQPHRAALVARAAAASGAGLAGVLAADGTRPAWPAGAFDRVLVDAPCSGVGALRRRPEARWRRTAADLDALVPLQRRLLGAALDAVRPGGAVLYATCSPVLAETAGVVEAVLAERGDAALEPALPALPPLPAGLDAAGAAGRLPGTVQLWPHRHGTDAMFLALLRRRGGRG